MTENSYLRDLSESISKILFLPGLTVLRLITTEWVKVSKNSYLRQFPEQLVFSADLTVLRFIITLWAKM